MKRPSFQFYPGDWLRDPSVRAVSYAARGLWTDMLCLMHESDRRGYLQLNSKPVTAEQLARMTGGSTDEVSCLLQELESSGVFSRTEHSVIYSRRMVRDEQKREKCVEAGRRGGNPTLKGGGKGQFKGRANRKPTPSSSSSISSSSPASAGDNPLPPFVDHAERDEPDWMIVEAEFIGRWNSLDGVATHHGNGLEGTKLCRPFREAWRDPGWRERAKQAMAKFPLQSGSTISLRKFLEPTTIDEILGGVHDFTRGKARRGSDPTRVQSAETDADFDALTERGAGQPAGRA